MSATPWLLLLLTVPSLPSTWLHEQQRQITVTGLVRDAGSGRPVVAATVVFDSLVVAATNETGEYEAYALSVSGSTMMLEFLRIGYTTGSIDRSIRLRVESRHSPIPASLRTSTEFAFWTSRPSMSGFRRPLLAVSNSTARKNYRTFRGSSFHRFTLDANRTSEC